MGYFKKALKGLDAAITHVIAREITMLSQRLSKVEEEVYNKSTRFACDYSTGKKAVEELQRRLDVQYSREVYYLLMSGGKYLAQATMWNEKKDHLVSNPAQATRFTSYTDAKLEAGANYGIRKFTVISENILDETNT